MQKYVTGVEKESSKKFSKSTIYWQLEIMVISQVKIEVQHIVFVIWNLMCVRNTDGFS